MEQILLKYATIWDFFFSPPFRKALGFTPEALQLIKFGPLRLSRVISFTENQRMRDFNYIYKNTFAQIHLWLNNWRI